MLSQFVFTLKIKINQCYEYTHTHAHRHEALISLVSVPVLLSVRNVLVLPSSLRSPHSLVLSAWLVTQSPPLLVAVSTLLFVFKVPSILNPSTVYVDQRALRVDRVTVLERGAPNSMGLLECGKILPDVKVMIVHPDTKTPCAHTDLGEVRFNSHLIAQCMSMCFNFCTLLRI